MLSRGFMKMSNLYRREAEPALLRNLRTLLIGVALLAAAGCSGERDADDGVVINSVLLPTDVVLNLACENVGIAAETCVLDDPENPYATTTILEFDVNNPDATNKFTLFNAIPPGPTGAKARFYLWATALARRQSGENQYYTALALHELFNANSNFQFQDELVRAQALKAYRSLLDNFFGSVTVFECCADISPSGDPVGFAVLLNERVADNLYRTAATASRDQFGFPAGPYPDGFRRLVDGDPLLVLELLKDWGYVYKPATPPNYDDGVVIPGQF